MPLPDDVVTVARQFDKQSNGAAIEARLDRTIEWLTEFRQAWRSRYAAHRHPYGVAGARASLLRNATTVKRRLICRAQLTLVLSTIGPM